MELGGRLFHIPCSPSDPTSWARKQNFSNTLLEFVATQRNLRGKDPGTTTYNQRQSDINVPDAEKSWTKKGISEHIAIVLSPLFIHCQISKESYRNCLWNLPKELTPFWYLPKMMRNASAKVLRKGQTFSLELNISQVTSWRRKLSSEIPCWYLSRGGVIVTWNAHPSILCCWHKTWNLENISKKSKAGIQACILSAQSTRFNATEQVKILNIILCICTKLGPRLRENPTHDPLRQATGETFPHFMLLRTLIW